MVLYQKYRPKTFKGIVNQEVVKKSLISAIKNDRVGHAYIFSGPRGTGKTTIARILSRAMNCRDRDEGQPCLVCESCRDNSSVDVIEIDAASNRKIDDIRALRERIKFSPIASKYKIYIIDEVHMLTTEAFNALLKILEEPPSHAIFILATTEPDKIPDTILSRCQKFNFKPIGAKKMAEYLAKVSKKEKIKINEQSLLMIAVASGGSLRDGLGILEQIAIGSQEEITADRVREILGLVEHRAIDRLIDLLIAGENAKAIDLVDQLIGQGIRYQRVTDSLLGYLRDLLVISLGSDQSTDLAEIQLKKARKQAKLLGAGRISTWMERIFQARGEEFENLPQLPLEMLVVDLIDDGETEEQTSSEKKTITRSRSNSVKKTKIKKKPVGRDDHRQESRKPTQQVKTKSKHDNQAGGQDKKAKDDIASSWLRIVAELKNYNHSLSAIAASCQVSQKNDQTLTILTDRRFYQRRILDLTNRKRIQKAIKKVTGKQCLIDCKVELKEEAKPRIAKKVDQLAKKAEEMF